MWRLCAVCALLVARLRARSSVCDDGQSNIAMDLPNENVYLCSEDNILAPGQVYPSVTTRYKEEETYCACMDVIINYTSPIPNSGAHRPMWAKYGEYTYCPPQRWVHNLQHAGVAFLYHPCVNRQLKEALSFVARSCVPKYIITPLPSLSRERPIALATWCSTLEMSHINMTEILYWLKENVNHKRQRETEDGTYQHLLIRPSLLPPSSAHLCSERDFQVLNHRGRPVWRLRKRRRAVVLATTVDQDVVSASIFSSNLAKHHMDKTSEYHSTVTQPARTNGLFSTTESFTFTPVTSTEDSNLPGIKASVYSRDTEENDNMPVQRTMPTPGNQSVVQSAVGSNVSPEPDKEQSVVAHKDHTADFLQKDMSLNIALRPHTTQPPQHPLTDTVARKNPSGTQKQECSCQHEMAAEASAKAQRRLGGIQQKSSEEFVSTPRTEEATWAAASLIFLFSLLTFSVLYSQIYKKFHKSQSLYWTSGNYSAEKETVASIIKRRLVQGHSRRKKWFGKKKNPIVSYESLSESSD